MDELVEESDVVDLFPDAESRAAVERERQRLPLSYFEETLAVPPGWDGRPGAYLAFGDTYSVERDAAERRGWPVRTLSGGHLHQFHDPEGVALAVLDLLRQVRLGT